MPFMYPEQLRELRAQYPNTQFDGHGRVVGGTPLDQYNAQPANPAAIPASVRTYSQFDPATGTWVRHTNGAVPAPASVQTPVQAPARTAQGIPVNFQEFLGYTPAGFEGATLNVGSNGSSRQVMRPLPRKTGGRRTTNTLINPITVNGEQALAYGNQGKTPSGVEFVDGTPISAGVTLGPQPVARTAPVNMSPDHQTPTPYVSNETIGLAGYNPNLAYTQNQLALGKHYRQTVPTRPLTVAEHLTRLFGGNKAREASNAMRAATGLPPLE